VQLVQAAQCLAQLALLDQLEHLGQQVQLALTDLMAKTVRQDQLALQEQLDLRGHQA
jgi:hypothetical protein